MIMLSAALRAAILFSVIGAGQGLRTTQVSAHEGHDHGVPPPATASNAAPRAEATSDAHELVAVARAGEITIYVDRFATNDPVHGATVEVETPLGSEQAVVAGHVYRLRAPWAAKAGRYDLIVTVSHDGVADVLALTLEIPAGSATDDIPADAWMPALVSGIKQRLGHNAPAVVAAAVGGFLLGSAAMLLLLRRRKTVSAAILVVAALTLAGPFADAHEGEDQPSVPARVTRDVAQRLPDGGVFVPKATQRILAIRTVIAESTVHRRTVELPGRIIPDPNASGYVQASVGGRLSPPAGGFPRLGTPVKQGDVLAHVAPPMQAIDVSDMRQRQGELDQQISIVERRLARYETLVPGGAIARTQLEDTRLELQGLRERRAALDKARREPEALVAPVDGIVAEGTPVAGQIVQSNAVVFHIVDPSRLWVEALGFEALSGTPAATARLHNDRALSLGYRGSGFADRNQSIPIHFAIESDTSGLRLGQLVTVLAATDEEKQGIAVPRASVVRGGNGQDLVYEHVSAERFEPRAVRIEPLDGDHVLIAAGLAGGKRVVVQGAELLDQVR
jgi:RND family efflux transporter MFP subunit